jgi:hypothetical protein
MLADGLRIVSATIARVDVLVSWNFRHMVNLDRIHGLNLENSPFAFLQFLKNR